MARAELQTVGELLVRSKLRGVENAAEELLQLRTQCLSPGAALPRCGVGAAIAIGGGVPGALVEVVRDLRELLLLLVGQAQRLDQCAGPALRGRLPLIR